jgi:3-oxoacyl-[acyl-carrier-protein] synthase-3
MSTFAARAGAEALQRAGIEATELDLVLVATSSAEAITPNAAPVVAGLLEAHNAGAFDVGSACTGWLAGVAMACGQIESGRAEHALVVGCDFLSQFLDLSDRSTAPLFADGAGAAVFGPAAGDYGAVGPIVLGADGSGAAQAIVVRHSDRTLQLDGPEVYRHAVARMSESALAAVQRAGLTFEDIDLFVFHQANARITRALGERLELDPERVVDNIEHLGNSSAATLPLALATAEADGRLRPGTRVLLGAFGAGFTFGGGVIEWGGGRGARA